MKPDSNAELLCTILNEAWPGQFVTQYPGISDMNFAICGINGQLSESQKELRMLYHASRIRQVKATKALQGKIRTGVENKRHAKNNKTLDNY